jgi:hypothetical protein
MKSHFTAGLILVGTALAAWVFAAAPTADKSHKLTTISPRKFADALHAVIAADRDAGLRLFSVAAPGAVAGAAGPAGVTHAQLLREAATAIQRRGAEFSYALRGKWPVNPNQGPQTRTEEVGLDFLARNASTNFYAEEMLGGRSYFTAIYPDTATSAACVDCHNQNPASPRHDFRVGELMGAIIVRVPLEF